MNSFAIVIAFSVLAYCLAAPTGTSTNSSSSQCQTESVEEAKKAELALAKFAISMYKNLITKSNQDQEQQNQVLSPISIAAALALVENGADGETRREIQKYLVENEASNEVLSVYHALYKNLEHESAQSRLKLANGVFVDNRIQLRPEYEQSTQQCMAAKVQQMDFKKSPEECRKEMNKWVAQKTLDKIPELFQQGSVTAQTTLALANAIHFKAPWLNAFSQDQTEKGVFYSNGKEEEQQQVQFMKNQNGNFGHYADGRMQLLEMKYQGDVQAAMYVMLPNKRDGLRELEQEMMDADKLKQILTKVAMTPNMEVQLPKFAIRSTIDMTQLLKNVGLKNLFSDQAELTRIGHR